MKAKYDHPMNENMNRKYTADESQSGKATADRRIFTRMPVNRNTTERKRNNKTVMKAL